MKYSLIVAALVTAALAASSDPAPTPCGRELPNGQRGICTTRQTCYDKDGTYIGRGCGSLSLVCCYVKPKP